MTETSRDNQMVKGQHKSTVNKRQGNMAPSEQNNPTTAGVRSLDIII